MQTRNIGVVQDTFPLSSSSPSYPIPHNKFCCFDLLNRSISNLLCSTFSASPSLSTIFCLLNYHNNKFPGKKIAYTSTLLKYCLHTTCKLIFEHANLIMSFLYLNVLKLPVLKVRTEVFIMVYGAQQV